ncbi:MAG: hypothetical protein O9256_01940 [Rhizobiaceae bacterium]|nr:hypothetical protein [Rhizobiaceae bacterium]MCZ8349843.1 hypothetical protein [Rhizobium sp.]
MEGVKKALHPAGSRPVMCGNAVLGYVTDRRITRRNWALPAQRLADLEKLIRGRHGSFVDDDNASSYLLDLARAVVNSHRASARQKGREANDQELVAAVVAACRKWLPVLTFDEVEEEALDAIDHPAFEKADVVAKRLGVTFAERQSLGLKTIGCRDLNKRQRKAAVKAAKVASRKAQRRAAGVKSREEYVANSVTALARSWGVSRQTIYDWRKADDPRGLYMCDPNMGEGILASDLSSNQATAQRPFKAASAPKAVSQSAGSLSGPRPVAPRLNKKKPTLSSAGVDRLKNNIEQVLLYRERSALGKALEEFRRSA